VVPLILSAGPVAGVVLPIVLVPVTFSVPAPDELKTALVPLSVMPPEKFIVAPLFAPMLMPAPVSLIAPVKATVPPVCPLTSTEFPALLLSGAFQVILAVPVPPTTKSSPVAFVMLLVFTAEKVPFTLERLTPLSGLFVLVIKAL